MEAAYALTRVAAALGGEAMNRHRVVTEGVRRLVGTCALAAGLVSVGCGGESREREARAMSSATEELTPVINGQNRFALNLYREIAKHEGNLFFAPFSVYSTLALAYAGASDDTAAELGSALGVTGDDALFHQQLGALIRDLNGDHGRGYTLRIASGMFGDRDAKFAPEFVELGTREYGAGIEAVDLAQPERARQRINSWIEKRTHGDVAELVPQGSLSPLTLLVAANAMRFSAHWAERFAAIHTQNAPFRTTSGETVSVPTMHHKFDGTVESGTLVPHVHCNEEPGLRVAEISYEDDEVGMAILLPTNDEPLRDLEAALDVERLSALLSGMRTCGGLEIALPRFDFRTELSLTESLKALGIERAFDSELAEFTKLEQQPRSISVSDVLHEAHVHVDERGTDASGASGSAFVLTAPPTPFNAERDFVFLIRDRLTGAILFMGRVSDPR